MERQELLDILENGMTVGGLIQELGQFDKGMLVVNTRSKEYLPISNVKKTSIEYCYDDIITKDVVSIW